MYTQGNAKLTYLARSNYPKILIARVATLIINFYFLPNLSNMLNLLTRSHSTERPRHAMPTTTCSKYGRSSSRDIFTAKSCIDYYRISVRYLHDPF